MPREVLLVLFCQESTNNSSNGSSRLASLIKSLKSLFRCDSGACSSFRALLFWCREVLLVLFCRRQQQQQQRQHPSSISYQFLQVFSSSKVSEVTLGTLSVRFWSLFVLPCFPVSVRFCGLFVLPCLAVLVPGGAFGALLSAAAADSSSSSSNGYL